MTHRLPGGQPRRGSEPDDGASEYHAGGVRPCVWLLPAVLVEPHAVGSCGAGHQTSLAFTLATGPPGSPMALGGWAVRWRDYTHKLLLLAMLALTVRAVPGTAMGRREGSGEGACGAGHSKPSG
jgi:hypothetical protein